MKDIFAIASKVVPEGRFKEGLLKVFYRYRNDFYDLNKMISHITYCEEGLFVELNNGLKFHGSPNETFGGYVGGSKLYNYGCPRKLDKIRSIDFEHFNEFLCALRNLLVWNIFEKQWHVEKGDIVIDMGAHIGTFSIKAAKEVGDEGKVIAIEPEQSNLRFLKRNIEANGLKNVIVVPKGVWSNKDKMKLYLAKGRSTTHTLGSDLVTNDKFIEIEVDTLDNILEQLRVTRVDFIKMNIEGAEIEALKGMRRTLENNDAKLVIGVHHTIEGKSTHETVVQQLTQCGFRLYGKNNKLLTVYMKKS